MTARDDQKRATEARVIAAAEHLFWDRGFPRTTIRDIAAEASVSTGTVMTIGDKAALLVAAFDRAIGRIHRARTAAGRGSTERMSNPVDRILELVAPFLAAFADHPDLAREYAAILARGAHGTTIFGPLADALVSEMQAVLAGAGFADADAATGARACYLAYLGALFAGAGRGGTDTEEPAADFASALHFIIRPRGEGS